MLRVLLHDDDALLEGVLLLDLLLKLAGDEAVGVPRVLAGGDVHGGVLEHGDGAGEVGDDLGGDLALFGDGGGELAGVELDVLDVGLDLGAELLQVLDDGHVDSLGQVGVMVGDGSGLLALWTQT